MKKKRRNNIKIKNLLVFNKFKAKYQFIKIIKY